MDNRLIEFLWWTALILDVFAVPLAVVWWVAFVYVVSGRVQVTSVYWWSWLIPIAPIILTVFLLVYA